MPLQTNFFWESRHPYQVGGRYAGPGGATSQQTKRVTPCGTEPNGTTNTQEIAVNAGMIQKTKVVPKKWKQKIAMEWDNNV